MEMLLNLLPICVFLAINSAFCLLANKKFGRTIPFVLMVSTILMFASQLIFETFDVAVYSILIIFVISVLYLIINKNNIYNILTLGFYAFIVITIIFLIIDFKRRFFWCDELTHWGKMVKEMLRLDKFYYVNESTLRVHKDYPPFISLFELLWTKLSIHYYESNITYALHFFECSIFIPCFAEDHLIKSNDKKIFSAVLFCLIMISILICLDAESVFNTIYVDILIPILFSYSMYLIINEINSTYNYICFCCCLSSIIIAKQVGIAFVLLALLFYFLSLLKNINKKNIIRFVFVSILTFSLFITWKQLINSYNIAGQFDFSNINLENLKNILSGNGYQYETIKLYINSIFKRDIFGFPIRITYASSLLITILLTELSVYICDNNKKTIRKFEIILVVGTLGYAFMMLILYTYCFPIEEALKLISFDRYMSSYFCGEILTIIYLYIYQIKCSKRKVITTNELSIIFLLLIVIFGSNKLLEVMPQCILGNPFKKYENISHKIERNVEDYSKVFVVYEHGDDYVPGYASYYTDKVYMNLKNMNVLRDAKSEKNQIIEELKTYDYLYVNTTNANFNEEFSGINNNKEFENDSLYKIINANDNIEFIKIDEN